jgi:hypothetical protein
VDRGGVGGRDTVERNPEAGMLTRLFAGTKEAGRSGSYTQFCFLLSGAIKKQA